MPNELIPIAAPEQEAVIAAIAASWSRDTSATPGDWTPDNPAKGQCDVSSFVAWEFFGGDLVLGEVHVGTEFQEFHYWNRIGGTDLDLTQSQFTGREVISEVDTLTATFVQARRAGVRPDVAQRIERFRAAVGRRLAGE